MRLASTAAASLAVLSMALLGADSNQGCGGRTAGGIAASGERAPLPSDWRGVIRARLDGYQETPAVSTSGRGSFRATVSPDGTSIAFELSYADLEGLGEAGAPTGAHIHLGQRGVAGGISVHLCGTGERPACPAPPATVTGTITSGDVVGPAAQGIAAGELDELLRAVRAGVAYVNVHSAAFPAGQIRGQIRARGERDDDPDDG